MTRYADSGPSIVCTGGNPVLFWRHSGDALEGAGKIVAVGVAQLKRNLANAVLGAGKKFLCCLHLLFVDVVFQAGSRDFSKGGGEVLF